MSRALLEHYSDPLGTLISACTPVRRLMVSTPEGSNYSAHPLSSHPMHLAQLCTLNDSLSTGGLSDPRTNNPT